MWINIAVQAGDLLRRRAVKPSWRKIAEVDMAQTTKTDGEYRGYALTAVQRSPGWQIRIDPGPGLLRTRPDHVSASTKKSIGEDPRHRRSAPVTLRTFARQSCRNGCAAVQRRPK
jgi:hypothetical protein